MADYSARASDPGRSCVEAGNRLRAGQEVERRCAGKPTGASGPPAGLMHSQARGLAEMRGNAGWPDSRYSRGVSDSTAPEVPQEDGASDNGDVQSLLASLNLDGLLASLEAAFSGGKQESAGDAAETPEPAPQEVAPEERRGAPRLSPEDLATEIRVTIPGSSADVAMVNISETGVLLETNRYLKPGSAADLFVRLAQRRHTVRARIVRSVLHSIKSKSGVIYRAALHFDKPLPIHKKK